ncbi:MerR family transcriptional regulator [Nocardia sp. ET3-3]|uniref:MerR family transcriptional regulator n=1 Tax=Nocardia terrae TaxID=2675851 RepID=A0A7K1VA15_9NOCA|nr:MerR family transcriptional regulator [Nocardia terrae]
MIPLGLGEGRQLVVEGAAFGRHRLPDLVGCHGGYGRNSTRVEVQVNVRQATGGRRRVGIGELSRLTGVPVRTIRFYCDEGVLAAERTSGGHRVFDPAVAVERVVLVRRLRRLGLGLTAIVEVMGGCDVVDAVEAERRAVDEELAALLRRREALTAVAEPRRVHASMVAFWRGLLEPLPPDLFEAFLVMNVPAPPAGRDARRLVAYAEIGGVLADPGLRTAVSRQLWRTDPGGIRHPRALLVGVAEACQEVDVLLRASASPRPGPALDRFVAAHAAARGLRDTPAFRRLLLSGATDSDQRIHRYWDLTGEITGTTTTGAAQHWLLLALCRSAYASGVLAGGVGEPVAQPGGGGGAAAVDDVAGVGLVDAGGQEGLDLAQPLLARGVVGGGRENRGPARHQGLGEDGLEGQ